jgi:hypothetical protein
MQQQDTHAQVWAQIPWLVNGRATPAQRHQAEQHLLSCTDCQAELSRQQVLAEALNEMPGGLKGDVDKGWAVLSQRLPPQASKPRSEESSGTSRRWVRWLGGLVAVEALAVAALALVIIKPTFQRAPDEGFTTLSTPSALSSEVRWRVLPDPAQSLAQWQANLVTHQVQVLGGPSSAGVWSLGWAGAQAPDVEAVAQALRTSPGVRFVEVMPHVQ